MRAQWLSWHGSRATWQAALFDPFLVPAAAASDELVEALEEWRKKRP